MTRPTWTLAELMHELGRRTGLRTHTGRLDVLQRVFAHHVGTRGDGSGHPDDPELMAALVDAAAIDESYFFRHLEQLGFLRSTVLPQLLAERGHDHTLRLWSAGCADGEEPYTLAIVLAEEGVQHRAEVLATDLSAHAVARARAATYTPWSLRSAEISTRAHLFESVAARRRLVPEVAGRVTFRQHNLLDDVYPRPAGAAGFDVILCRNVLVHLEPEAVAVVIPRLAAALAPGGWLVTAPADPPALDVAGAEQLQPIVLPTGGLVYRRRDGRAGGPGRASDAAGVRAAAETNARQRTRPRRVLGTQPRRRSAPATPAPTAAVDGRTSCLTARRLLAEGRADEALREAQAAAFLEPALPATHLTLALAASAADHRTVAARAFRRAAELLGGLPADEPVELCDGETAGQLADLARAHALLASEPAE